MLERWNTLTLKKIMNRAENSGKTTIDCLELLILELRQVQNGLDPDLQTEKLLHRKVIDACRGIPACKQACFKPSSDLGGLFNELREAIAIFEPPTEGSETLFTDRRYHKQTPFSRPPPPRTPPSRPRTNNYGNRTHAEPHRRQATGKKQCFVCGKEGCWSNRHSQEEQEESRQRYGREIARDYKYYKNNPKQYVTEYEGTEPGEEYDPDLDEEFTIENPQALVVDTSPSPTHPAQEQTELFLTSFGPIPPETATKITDNLADRLFVHAITGLTTPDDPPITPEVATDLTTPDDPPITPEVATDLTTPETPQLDPHVYVNATRYTADRFYGVVIDTGASQRSTAGYKQVAAYQKSHPITIDTTRAGMVKVQFGIGTASSTGSVTIKTPIGSVEFHVVRADTPFLLCLADMDALGVYYNNLKTPLSPRKAPSQ